MRDILYFFAKIRSKIRHSDDEVISNFLRSEGVHVGKNCHIYSNILTPESYLISIGDNTTLSNNIHLITHDNSICKVIPKYTDFFGEIRIGNNVFIGAHSTILGGVTLADNVIVGAGSVVTKSFFESEIIIAGNPARKIGNWSAYREKYQQFALNVDGLTDKQKKKLILESHKIFHKE